MKALLALLAAASAFAMAGNSPASGQSRFSTMYSFTDGFPLALSRISRVFYGAFQSSDSCGYVFSLESSAANASGERWDEAVLYNFKGYGDACSPGTAPVPGPLGALYGLALSGGASGGGAMYALQPPTEPGGQWSESVAYSLSGPVGNLVHGPDGSFYALDVGGGAYGGGDLLQLAPPAVAGGAWAATNLYDFPNDPGALVQDSLIAGPNGLLYGTSHFGGNARGGYGTVFQLTPPPEGGGQFTLKILHSFGSGTGSGGNPVALTLASDGTLYGVTCGAGVNCSFIESGSLGEGVAFQLTPPASGEGPWSYTVLANFGQLSLDSPLVERGGNLYGTYESSSGGALFELEKPAAPGGPWTVKYLHLFTGGQVPFGPLIMDENGILYGTTGSLFDTVQTGTVYRIETQ
jgi:hypothetical protein